MNIVFVMDPLENINPFKDSSYVLMLAATRQGHHVFYVPNSGLHLSAAGLQFEAMPVTPSEDRAHPFETTELMWLSEAEIDAVFIRTDPPFDDSYLMNTWLLDRLDPRIKVINSPQGIRTVNEKIWATQFKAVIPETLITSNLALAKKFLIQQGHIVAKPANGFGGSSVFKLSAGDSNASVVFETLSHLGKSKMILQAYIDAAQVGDKRVLLVDGEPVGCVLRVHSPEDHRNNFFAGGKPAQTSLTARDQEIIAILKPHLNALGLRFVGIDIIGDYLIEVNVTSPTCIQEINALTGRRVEDEIFNQLLT